MVISPKLYGAMEEWIRTRRAHLKPTHDFLFTSKNGGPLTDTAVHRLLTSTSYRLTGRRTNPHLIRDMIITHLRGTDASERELEALAIYMGHSVAMQKGTYDRRTKEEKVGARGGFARRRQRGVRAVRVDAPHRHAFSVNSGDEIARHNTHDDASRRGLSYRSAFSVPRRRRGS